MIEKLKNIFNNFKNPMILIIILLCVIIIVLVIYYNIRETNNIYTCNQTQPIFLNDYVDKHKNNNMCNIYNDKYYSIKQHKYYENDEPEQVQEPVQEQEQEQDTLLLWENKIYDEEFGNYTAKKALKHLIDEFGKPDNINKNKGGYAIWTKDTLNNRGFCWDRIELYDIQIPHTEPIKHYDFLYTWITIDIPKNKIDKIKSISNNIEYDEQNKILRVRCNSMSMNKILILIVILVAKKDMDVDDAIHHYTKFIFLTKNGRIKNNPKAEFIYEQEICDNI